MSYTKTYQGTGSTLTINYPEGLFDVIENPREYFMWIDSEEDWGAEGEDRVRCEYPDVLLVPTNGSRIGLGKTYIKRKFKEYEIDENGERLYAENDLTPDYLVANDVTENIQLWNDNTAHLKSDCSTMSYFPVDENLMQNEWEYNRDKSNFNAGHSLRYFKKVWDIEITIEGETAYFESNADRYFCIGDSEGQTAYFTTRFPQKQMVVGMMEVREQQVDETNENDIKIKTIDLYAVSLLKRSTRSAHGESPVEYSSLSTCQCLPNGTTISRSDDEFLQPNDDLLCDGYDGNFVFPRNNNGNQYSLKGKKIVFKSSYLVCIAKPGARQKCLLEKQDNGTVKIVKRMVGNYQCTFLPATGMFPIKFDGGSTYYTTNNSSISICGKYLSKLDFFDDQFYNFTGYFATDPTDGEDGDMSKYVIGPGTDFPIKEFGVNLYPIFTVPICTHLALITEHDHNGAFIPIRERTSSINDRMKSIFKDEYQYIKADKWSDTSVAKQLKKLKKSPSKLKVLSIVGHGGQYGKDNPDKTGMSFTVFADVDNVSRERAEQLIINYDMLEYLMKDRRQDEYYCIFSSSCFGGGIVEKPFIHTDFNNDSYSSILPNGNLGSNYMFGYADCGNSPEWSTNDNFMYEDESLFNKTYEECSRLANTQLQQVRQENIETLVNLIKKHYQFITGTLLNDKCRFPQPTCEDSMSKAGNLLIYASKLHGQYYIEMNDDVRTLVNEQPVVWLVYRVFGSIEGIFRTLPHVWMKLLADEDADKETVNITKKDFFKNPNGFFSGAKRFAETNKRVLSETAKKYLPMKKEENGEDVTMDNYIKQLNDFVLSTDVDQSEKANRKRTFDGFVQFFYDCYVCLHKMGNKGASLQDCITYYIQDWYLDDIPGMILDGSQEFKQCGFPRYPGIDKDLKKQ